MSTQYNASIVYGFPCPPNYLDLFGKNEKGHQIYLWEWLERNRLEPAEHLNAGKSNGGYPEQMVGVVLHLLEDFTRDEGYTAIPSTLAVSTKAEDAIRRAAHLLGVSDSEIGFYLVGEAA